MGSYVSLRIGSADFLQCKNSFGGLLLFFSFSDIHAELDEFEDGEKYTKRYLQTTVGKAKRGLDVLGHTCLAAKELFEENKHEYIEYNQEYEKRFDLESIQTKYVFEFEDWVKAVKKHAKKMACLKTKNYNEWHDYYEKEKELNHPFMEQLVVESLPYFSDDTYFGMNVELGSVWDVFRIVLEAFDDNQEIILDYTDLYEGGWCDEEPPSNLFEVQKIIILTEGKFDAYVISEAMKILYPDMVKYYSFIDFSEYAVQGSTSFLSHYLRAFIAAKVENKIIALFDNDTAGMVAIKGLEKISLPQNVRITHLPDIALCEEYPTIGPVRNEKTNINGKACSIEMFLGRDILRIHGEYEPIQWKGYEDTIKAYQGEVVNKKGIEDRFREKVKMVNNGGQINLEDWAECKILLEHIFNIFVHKNV